MATSRGLSTASEALPLVAGSLCPADKASLRLSCRLWRDAVDATLPEARARLGQPPMPPRWEHWQSLRFLVLTVPRVHPSYCHAEVVRQLQEEVAALGLERLSISPSASRLLELRLAAPQYGCPATSLGRLHHALTAAGALARFGTVIARGPAQLDSSFDGRLAAAEVRLDTPSAYLVGHPADAFSGLVRLSLVVTRRSQQALLQCWLAAETLPRCTTLAVTFCPCADDLSEEDAVDICLSALQQLPVKPVEGKQHITAECVYQIASQICLAKHTLGSSGTARSVPLPLLLPGTPAWQRAQLMQPVPPLQLEDGVLDYNSVHDRRVNEELRSDFARKQLLAAIAGMLQSPPADQQLATAGPSRPPLLSQLRALELTDVVPAGGPAALTSLTQLTRLHLHVESADDYNCYLQDEDNNMGALTALLQLAVLSINGMHCDETLSQLQSLTELCHQIGLGESAAGGGFWVAQHATGLGNLCRLSVPARLFYWLPPSGRVLDALRTLPGLQQLIIEDWCSEAETWHKMFSQAVPALLSDAPGLQLLHLPNAVMPGPYTTDGGGRFLHSTAQQTAVFELHWQQMQALHPHACWDVRVERVPGGGAAAPTLEVLMASWSALQLRV